MLQWGKLGTAGQQKLIPAEQCENSNVVLELECRAAKKVKDGYAVVPGKSLL